MYHGAHTANRITAKKKLRERISANETHKQMKDKREKESPNPQRPTQCCAALPCLLVDVVISCT
jgi:hypothetical protein